MAFIFPILLAAMTSNYRALEMAWKTHLVKKKLSSKNQFLDKYKLHNILLKEKIYVPVEDFYQPEASESIFHLQDFSSQGKIYAWIPIKLRVPILGEKVIEWQTSFP